jgi:hypothetical protein
MKTLILMLAVVLTSPAYSQTDYTESEDSSVSGSASDTVLTPTEEESGLPFGTESESESAASGALTDPSAPQEDSRMTGGSQDIEETETTTTTIETEERVSGASPAEPSPSQAQPSQSLQPAQPATAETASRTKEDMARREPRRGGFYIEPALVGIQQDVDAKGGLIGSDVNGTSNGFGADLKLGGHINETFFLAADGRYERVRFAETTFEDVNADVLNYGATIGLQAPWAGVRAWGTYVLGGTYDAERANNGADLRFEDPYGWRAGLGFRFQAISLNLEYQDLTYQTTEIESAGTLASANTGNIDFGQRGYALSLSFPIEL